MIARLGVGMAEPQLPSVLQDTRLMLSVRLLMDGACQCLPTCL